MNWTSSIIGSVLNSVTYSKNDHSGDSEILRYLSKKAFSASVSWWCIYTLNHVYSIWYIKVTICSTLPNNKYSSSSPEFIILYGRRRVGKTELIKQFIKNKPAVYFLADRQIDRENLSQMQRSMAIYLSEPLFKKAPIGAI